MAGVSAAPEATGKRKSLDSEINMIPMIDLLMVTISFLLITAVWTHMARIEASAKVPSPDAPTPCEGAECTPEAELHVDMRAPERFVLSWRQKGVVLSTLDVPREPGVRYPGLAAEVERQWRARGVHLAPTDRRRDRAVLSASNTARYEEMIGAMDAIQHPKREGPSGAGAVPAFAMTFSIR